jgi:hypothetical protein
MILLVLYYFTRVGTLGKGVLSVLFPLHEGLTVERLDELDVYYDDDEAFLLNAGEEGWYDPEYALEGGEEEDGRRFERKKK